MKKLRDLFKEAIEQERFRVKEPEEVFQAFFQECRRRLRSDVDGLSFPCQRIYLELHASTETLREQYESKFLLDDRIKRELIEYLKQQGCGEINNLEVRVTLANNNDNPALIERGYAAVFKRVVKTISKAELKILDGEATKKRYSLTRNIYNIGREEKGSVAKHRRERRNDIEFLETEAKANQGVSRNHAHIKLNSSRDGYVVFDDVSKNGTKVERDGMMYKVDGNRGVELRNGDIIYFGDAQARFLIQYLEKEISC